MKKFQNFIKKYVFLLFINNIFTLIIDIQYLLAKSIDHVNKYNSNLDVKSYKSTDITDTAIADISKSTKNLIQIQSEKIEGIFPQEMKFLGNVEIKKGNITLNADEIEFFQKNKNNHEFIQLITAIGNVLYTSEEIILKSNKIIFNVNTNDTDIVQGTYELIKNKGRGKANIIIQREDNRFTILKDVNFTSCLSNDNSWMIIGSKMIYDSKKQIVKIWNAYLKIYNIPIFYIPYVQFPIINNSFYNNFIPNIKYNYINNILEFNIPYYIKIYLYDVIVTLNYINNRGIHIKTEVSNLISSSSLIKKYQFNWLFHDFLHYKNDSISNKNRWFFHCLYNGKINTIWRIDVDYTKISDFNYFNDINQKFVQTTTNNYLKENFSFGFSDEKFNIIFVSKRFNIFDNLIDNVYHLIPQIEINYDKILGPFNFKLKSQISNFRYIKNESIKTIRCHIEPTVDCIVTNSWSSLNTIAKLMVTYYQQNNIDKYNKKNFSRLSSIEESIKRIIPVFKIDGKILLLKNLNMNYIQIIEPRIEYLYIKYNDQKNIGIYDSIPLQTDYLGLFRDFNFSSLDKISSSNNIKIGITTNIYNNNNIEILKASIGTIYSFTSNEFTDYKYNLSNYMNNIILVGDNAWYINNNFSFKVNFKYNIDLKILESCNSILEYRYFKNYILNINYYYVNSKYIFNFFKKNNINYNYDDYCISKLELSGNVPINKNLSLSGSYFYNIKNNISLNKMIGIQYHTCCLSINLGYEKKFLFFNNSKINYLKNKNHYKYDDKILFNIELKSL